MNEVKKYMRLLNVIFIGIYAGLIHASQVGLPADANRAAKNVNCEHVQDSVERLSIGLENHQRFIGNVPMPLDRELGENDHYAWYMSKLDDQAQQISFELCKTLNMSDEAFKERVLHFQNMSGVKLFNKKSVGDDFVELYVLYCPENRSGLDESESFVELDAAVSDQENRFAQGLSVDFAWHDQENSSSQDESDDFVKLNALSVPENRFAQGSLEDFVVVDAVSCQEGACAIDLPLDPIRSKQELVSLFAALKCGKIHCLDVIGGPGPYLRNIGIDVGVVPGFFQCESDIQLEEIANQVIHSRLGDNCIELVINEAKASGTLSDEQMRRIDLIKSDFIKFAARRRRFLKHLVFDSDIATSASVDYVQECHKVARAWNAPLKAAMEKQSIHSWLQGIPAEKIVDEVPDTEKLDSAKNKIVDAGVDGLA